MSPKKPLPDCFVARSEDDKIYCCVCGTESDWMNRAYLRKHMRTFKHQVNEEGKRRAGPRENLQEEETARLEKDEF